MTKREIISLLRSKIRETTSDTLYMDKHLYFLLEEESNWIIRREIKSLKLTQSKTFYQILPCMPTIEVDKIDERCPVKIDNLTIYRSEYKIPDMWETEVGPIIRRILSIDNYNEFKIISQSDWEAKSKNPYYKKNKQLYCIFEDNYLWFPKEHPKNINIDAAFKDSVSKLEYCKCGENDSDCTPYLDTLFTVPKYLYSEIVSKIIEKLLGQTSKVQEDENLNKNTNIKS